ncbi:MAG: hypothetical protein QM516_13715 [Limnohabitans sp.]|jgi:hypothetical protein|nr:hypothetical protein [Limnohabitans sp.]
MHQSSNPSLPHTQGMADAAIDAAWAVMPPDAELETARLLPIVVGAHPRAEIADRPLANRLVAAIRQWQRTHIADESRRLVPLVMTDLWYLNDRELLLQPSVAIGEPGTNAASAYFGTRLPQAYVVHGQLQVFADLEFLEPSIAMWGSTAHSTRSALDWLIARQLERFLESVHF